jgi:hypothetical protein
LTSVVQERNLPTKNPQHEAEGSHQGALLINPVL